jgi:predicted small secreted protein
MKINSRVRTVVSLAAAAAFLTLLAGCNTVKGAGQDLTEASDNTKKAISK